MHQLDFKINSGGIISKAFLSNNIFTFLQATQFIAKLNYGRNKNKKDLTTVFTDGCGTCSTKHALLKSLAEENDFKGLKLMLGIFRMNAVNTPQIAETLKLYNLNYILEAHNYLNWKSNILDYTNETSLSANFYKDLIVETEIQANEISEFKINYHRNILTEWIKEYKPIGFTIDKLWLIREQCIKDLSNN